MASAGILKEEEIGLHSELGQAVVKFLMDKEKHALYQARERQLRIAQAQKERRIFGDGARVTMSLDPVLAMRIAKDPRFGPSCFGEGEFEKDMRKWHPEFMVKSRSAKKTFNLGAVPRRPEPQGILTVGKYTPLPQRKAGAA